MFIELFVFSQRPISSRHPCWLTHIWNTLCQEICSSSFMFSVSVRLFLRIFICYVKPPECIVIASQQKWFPGFVFSISVRLFPDIPYELCWMHTMRFDQSQQTCFSCFVISAVRPFPDTLFFTNATAKKTDEFCVFSQCLCRNNFMNDFTCTI